MDRRCMSVLRELPYDAKPVELLTEVESSLEKSPREPDRERSERGREAIRLPNGYEKLF